MLSHGVQITSGDRFISMREDINKNGDGQDLDSKFDTKIELFNINHLEEERQRRQHQLISDPQKTEKAYNASENQKKY